MVFMLVMHIQLVVIHIVSEFQIGRYGTTWAQDVVMYGTMAFGCLSTPQSLMQERVWV
jgi:Na+/glutamate symporter